MTAPLVISVDAMGGDHGPSVVLPALIEAAGLIGSSVRFLAHGDPEALEPIIRKLPRAQGRIEIRPADGVIAMDAKPAHAMRRGKGSSMWNAVESVRTGEASAAVSAGNTGALMAISRLVLRMIGDLERPALVANWPTLNGMTSVLDVGANVVCDAPRLVDFAIMGSAYHRAAHGGGRPSVGLLNVGVEHDKGHEEVREADRLIRSPSLDINYLGFVEGDDIAKGAVDVVVTDGFTGNVALKTAEGLARFFRAELRKTFTAGPLAMAGAFVASGALREMSERLNPSTINGGPFLGLNGVVVKSHGSADVRGFAHAVRLAADLASSDILTEVADTLGRRARLDATSGTESQIA